MVQIRGARVPADIDGDFVALLIGIRVNACWKPHKWLPGFLAVPRMPRERSVPDETGLRGFPPAGEHNAEAA
jgi:hypothetical protein